MRWLLSIGEGKTYSKFEKDNDLFMIPTNLIINNDIVDTIYGNEIKESDITVHEKVILAPRNVDVLELNNKILALPPRSLPLARVASNIVLIFRLSRIFFL